jgi:hypothetical protein
MPSLAELYEHHARDCIHAAGRTENPKSREMLLKLAREWAAALQALTQSKPPSTGVGG